MVPSESVFLREYVIEVAIPQIENKILQLIEKDQPLRPIWYPEAKLFLCSRCKNIVTSKDNYCRNCGGKFLWEI